MGNYETGTKSDSTHSGSLVVLPGQKIKNGAYVYNLKIEGTGLIGIYVSIDQ